MYKRLCPQSSYSPEGAPLGLTPSNTTITAFGGHTIPHYGICELTLSHHGHTKSYAFHVVNTVGPTILGLPTCRDMKLATLNHDTPLLTPCCGYESGWVRFNTMQGLETQQLC